jgi:hypothetical protein
MVTMKRAYIDGRDLSLVGADLLLDQAGRATALRAAIQALNEEPVSWHIFLPSHGQPFDRQRLVLGPDGPYLDASDLLTVVGQQVERLLGTQDAASHSEAGSAPRWLPRTRVEWYAFLTLLVAVLTLMQAQLRDDTIDPRQIEAIARGAVEQLQKESAEPPDERRRATVLRPHELPLLQNLPQLTKLPPNLAHQKDVQPSRADTASTESAQAPRSTVDPSDR